MSSKKNKEEKTEAQAEGLPGQPIEGEAVEEAGVETQTTLEELQQQLDEARAQAAEYKDGWQRSVADFQNYKRRTDMEKSETYQMAIGTVVKRYLPIMDDLERALANRPEGLPWVEGIELIYRKLKTILENEGLKRIEAEGQPFDPNYHEAITQEPVEGKDSGTIVEVVIQGYMLGERVIRPAVVRVAQ